MKFFRKHYTPLMFVAAATATLGAQFAHATNADKLGKAESRVHNGNVNIRVTDNDGIDWIKIYETNGNGAPVGKPLKGGNKDFDCDATRSDVTVLDSMHGHNHYVEFKDCKGTSMEWIADSLTGTYHPGNDVTPDEDDDSALTIFDMNLDGIPDIVVLDPDTRTITVLIGNGDGSLQDPSLSIDRVIQLPKQERTDLGQSMQPIDNFDLSGANFKTKVGESLDEPVMKIELPTFTGKIQE